MDRLVSAMADAVHAREIFRAAGLEKLFILTRYISPGDLLHDLLPARNTTYTPDEAIKKLELLDKASLQSRLDLQATPVRALARNPGARAAFFDELRAELQAAEPDLPIHPDKAVIGATRMEKLAIGGLFALAAIGVCAAVASGGSLALLQAAAIYVYGSMSTVIVAGLAMPYLLSRPADAEKNDPALRLKVMQLEKDIPALMQAAGSNRPVSMRVWRDVPYLPRIFPAVAMRRWSGGFVIFDRDFLKKTPYTQLKGVAAHEVAHIRLHHLYLRLAMVAAVFLGARYAVDQKLLPERLVLNLGSQKFSVSTPLAAFFTALALQARRFEFQADRVASVLIKSPAALKRFFMDRGRLYTGKSLVETAEDKNRREGAEIPPEVKLLGRVVFGLPLQVALAPVRFVIGRHPASWRRQERLSHMHEPEKPGEGTRNDLRKLPRALLPELG